jgi:hypothetical protein
MQRLLVSRTSTYSGYSIVVPDVEDDGYAGTRYTMLVSGSRL